MDRHARTAYVVILMLTVGQLVVATFADGLPQFEGKAFGGRLVAYPIAMLLPPSIWWLATRRRHDRTLPWAGFAFIASPFLVDVTGNTLNLYDTVEWWDDLNHYVNWLLLSFGIGLLLERQVVRPVWVLVLLVTGHRAGHGVTDTLATRRLGTPAPSPRPCCWPGARTAVRAPVTR